MFVRVFWQFLHNKCNEQTLFPDLAAMVIFSWQHASKCSTTFTMKMKYMYTIVCKCRNIIYPLNQSMGMVKHHEQVSAWAD